MEGSPRNSISSPMELKSRIKIPKLKVRFPGKLGLLIGILALAVLIYNSSAKPPAMPGRMAKAMLRKSVKGDVKGDVGSKTT
jgi:hypothetical protein